MTRPTTSLLHSTPPPLFPMPGPLATTSGGPGSATSAGLPTVASAVAAAATRPPHPTPIMPSVSLPLPSKPLAALPMVPQQQQQQPPRTPIVLPPAHRSLPPLPDFLNSREAFNPATAAAAATTARSTRPSSSASRALFPSFTDLPATHTEAQEADSFSNDERSSNADKEGRDEMQYLHWV